jgi:hypothetical protein
LFKKNPGSSVDLVEPFQFSAIRDESNSSRVISVTGSHPIFADIADATAIGLFVKGFVGKNTILGFANQVDYKMALRIDSGLAVAQQSTILFADRNTDTWEIGKLSDNRFAFNYLPSGTSAILLNGFDVNPVSIMVNGTVKQVLQGAPDSGGTGFRTLVVAN